MKEASSSEEYHSSFSSQPVMNETPVSTMSEDSSVFRRSYSETSILSDPIEDEFSPSLKPRVINKQLKMKPSKLHLEDNVNEEEEPADPADVEIMKERFAKLLLGEDMSGGGKGVCTAVTISNAITNLYATVFGQGLKLEPLKHEKLHMWNREMNCLLSVCDYIVELIPRNHSFRDGTTLEVMESRPRSDIHINLPALRKLDAMLIEILQSFEDAEFWYAEQGSLSSSSTRVGSFRKIVVQRKEEKWWVPVPCVPPGGLKEASRSHLRQKKNSARQIHKAAMAINNGILSEMEIPDTYMASLPKSGKASVGDAIYKYMNSSEKFSPEHILNCVNISSEHEALELADRVEASMYTWRKKACLSHSKSSWNAVKDLMEEADRKDKNFLLAERAESVLCSLKRRYPELAQTSLDTSRIQFNRDVGQAVLESYSRVLEGLAFNIVAWIEDVLFVDKSVRNHDN